MPIGIANFPARVMNRRRKGLAFVALRAGAFLLILVAASLFPPSPAHSGGILHASPPRVGPEAYAVARATVVVSRTWVTVSDDEMSCRFEQTFLNDNDLPLEGMFLFPLETGGPLLAPQVRVDGIVQRHTVMSHDEFFPLLKELTTTTQDPSLLGLAGKSVLVVRSVHLAPPSATDHTARLSTKLLRRKRNHSPIDSPGRGTLRSCARRRFCHPCAFQAITDGARAVFANASDRGLSRIACSLHCDRPHPVQTGERGFSPYWRPWRQ